MEKDKIECVENGYNIDVVVSSEGNAGNPKLLERFLPLNHLDDRLSMSMLGYIHLSVEHVPSIIRGKYIKVPLGEVIPMYDDDVLSFPFNSLTFYIQMKNVESQ